MIKDISKTIKGGSVKQRLKLIGEHFAKVQTSGGKERLFTDHEVSGLVDTFKTPQEIQKYNQLAGYDKMVRNGISILEIQVKEFKEAMAYITGYCLLWESYDRASEMANSMLHEVKDKDLRKKLINRATENLFFYSKLEVEDGQYIRINTGKARNEKGNKGKTGDDYNLEGILQVWSNKASTLLAECKGMASAILDYMEEKDFTPKAYKEVIKTLLEPVEKDWSILPKYSKNRMEESGLLAPDKVRYYNKYFVYPMAEEIEPDQEIYKKMLDSMLNYER